MDPNQKVVLWQAKKKLLNVDGERTLHGILGHLASLADKITCCLYDLERATFDKYKGDPENEQVRQIRELLRHNWGELLVVLRQSCILAARIIRAIAVTEKGEIDYILAIIDEMIKENELIGEDAQRLAESASRIHPPYDEIWKIVDTRLHLRLAFLIPLAYWIRNGHNAVAAWWKRDGPKKTHLNAYILHANLCDALENQRHYLQAMAGQWQSVRRILESVKTGNILADWDFPSISRYWELYKHSCDDTVVQIQRCCDGIVIPPPVSFVTTIPVTIFQKWSAWVLDYFEKIEAACNKPVAQVKAARFTTKKGKEERHSLDSGSQIVEIV